MYKRQDIKSAILNLPSNKDYKREKIFKVSIDAETDEEIIFKIETRFAVYFVNIFVEHDGSLTLGGNIEETAYDNIDELLYESINQSTLGEWNSYLNFDKAKNVNNVIEEIINGLKQEEWIEVFKLLNKIDNSLNNSLVKAEEFDNAESLIKEFLSAYAEALN